MATILENIEKQINEGRLLEAAKLCEEAIAQDPDCKNAYYNHGFILYRLGKSEEAIPYFEKAHVCDPDFEKPVHGLLLTYAITGKYDKAHELCRQMLKKNPDDHFAYHNLVAYKKYEDEDDEDIKILNAAAQRDDLPEETRIAVLFSLAKVYDDIKQFDEAFSHCNEANRLFAKTHPFKDQRLFDAAEKAYKLTFNREFFEERKNFGNNSSTPIFVVGMPRSGTTLIEQILTAHPKICSKGELNLAEQFSASVKDRLQTSIAYPGCLLTAAEKFIRNLAKEYLALLTAGTGNSEYVIDKMPHNFWHLGLISLLFPNARFINCERNPMATGLSNYFCRFTYGSEYSYSLEGIGFYYRKYQSMMSHWNQTFPERIYNISYEKLIENRKEETKKLLEFCGVEWSDSCLSPHEGSNAIETASAWQARQPVYNSSVEKWKNYEEYLSPLKVAINEP